MKSYRKRDLPISFRFSKYSGCGNDFIILDNRAMLFPTENRALIQRLCHRNFGIGADGIILLERSAVADHKMRIFNADGSEAEMCGNGIRCLVKFIHHLDPSVHSCSIETYDGLLHGKVQDKEVSIQMDDPFAIEHINGIGLSLNTGVPHVVVFVDEVENLDVCTKGKEIRHHSVFAPNGTNVNFVKVEGPAKLSIRTYERGVENETLACGTGATAAAISAAICHGMKSPIAVCTRSQDILTINFQNHTGKFHHVTMTGPATKIFYGSFDLKTFCKTPPDRFLMIEPSLCKRFLGNFLLKVKKLFH